MVDFNIHAFPNVNITDRADILSLAPIAPAVEASAAALSTVAAALWTAAAAAWWGVILAFAFLVLGKCMHFATNVPLPPDSMLAMAMQKNFRSQPTRMANVHNEGDHRE